MLKHGKVIKLSYLHIENVSLSQSEITISIGDIKKIEALINPEDVIDSTVLSWSSSNTNIAEVDQSGNIIAKNEGKTVITVTTSNGKKATINVYVINYIKGDFDENGVANIFDVYAFLRALSNETELTQRKIFIIDMDENEAANIFDAYTFLRNLSQDI